jgi:BirA family transcriptional regulator, biotin operon repressor / biotin---[acetyl-CoA-carboxylase] ligase
VIGENVSSWLHYQESCSSTNTWMLDQIAAKKHLLHHGDVVFTHRQTAGRGQQGRQWFSTVGVLTASFYLDQLPASQLPYLSLLAGLAVIYAVEDLVRELQGKLRLKWANDVILADGKLAGILGEAVTSGNLAAAVLGVGLNLCVDFTTATFAGSSVVPPVSLHLFASVPEEISLLEKIRHYLLELSSLMTAKNPDLTAFLPELHQRDWLLDRQIGLTSNGEEYLGTARGIDERGQLLIRLEDDQVRAFGVGRVFLQ